MVRRTFTLEPKRTNALHKDVLNDQPARSLTVAMCLTIVVSAHAASWHHLNDVVLLDPEVAGPRVGSRPAA